MCTHFTERFSDLRVRAGVGVGKASLPAPLTASDPPSWHDGTEWDIMAKSGCQLVSEAPWRGAREDENQQRSIPMEKD